MLVYEVGDIVQLKKNHPCGSKEWEILRVGADFKLKCLGCGHEIMLKRTLVEKSTKNIRKKIKKTCQTYTFMITYFIVIYNFLVP